MPSKPRAAKLAAASPARIEALRADSIRAMLDLEESIARIRDQLKTIEVSVRRARRLVETHHRSHEVAVKIGAAQKRATTSSMIQEVQSARHRAHQAAFKLAVAEGCNMADVARDWGVSRQLVSRIVREPSPRRKRRA
jgi:transposase-like protein